VEDRQRWIETLEAHKKFIEANGVNADGARAAAQHHLVIWILYLKYQLKIFCCWLQKI
jgi:hypothetical protein